MKFKTLNNKEIRLDIKPSFYPIKSRNQSKSIGQFNLGQLIQSIYGLSTLLLEEFTIPGTKLSLDFYMPNNNLAFEYQGVQHGEFNEFFHKDKAGFKKQIERDDRKKQWCDLNDIDLVVIWDNEDISVDILKTKIEENRNEIE